MPVTLSFEKAPNADRVRVTPSPLQIRLAQNRDADGRTRVEIRAGQSFNDRPGADKTVTWRFRTDAHRALFEPLSQPEPFVMRPGDTITLVVRQNLGLENRPASGPDATPFKRQSNGQRNAAFTRGADLVLVSPLAEAEHDHGAVEIEN